MRAAAAAVCFVVDDDCVAVVAADRDEKVVGLSDDFGLVYLRQDYHCFGSTSWKV
jgi:hypothetical protein